MATEIKSIDTTLVASAADLSAIVTAIGSDKRTLYFAEDINVSGTVTVPANITLVPQGGAKLTGSGTVTINSFDGSGVDWQCFSSTLTVTYYGVVRPEWFGATRDGVSNDYAALVKSVGTGNRTILLKKGTYLISDIWQIAYSGINIIGEDGAIIKMGSDTMAYMAIIGYSKTDIKIYNVTFDANFRGSNNHNGHCLVIAASKRVFVEKCKFINTKYNTPHCIGGDGIYVLDDSAGNDVMEDITIKDCHIEDIGRNGISIIAGRKIRILNTRIKTNNLCGIDIEPDTGYPSVEDVEIDSCTLESCSLDRPVTFGSEGAAISVIHPSGTAHYRIKVTNNRIVNCSKDATKFNTIIDSIVSGNTIENCTGRGLVFGDGLPVCDRVTIDSNKILDSSNSTIVTITNSTISNNSFTTSGYINFGNAYSENNKISNNTFIDCDGTTHTTYIDQRNSIFSGNTIIDSRLAASVPASGIYLADGCVSVVVDKNTISGAFDNAILAPLNMAGSGVSKIKIRNNKITGATTALYLNKFNDGCFDDNEITDCTKTLFLGEDGSICKNLSISRNMFKSCGRMNFTQIENAIIDSNRFYEMDDTDNSGGYLVAVGNVNTKNTIFSRNAFYNCGGGTNALTVLFAAGTGTVIESNHIYDSRANASIPDYAIYTSEANVSRLKIVNNFIDGAYTYGMFLGITSSGSNRKIDYEICGNTIKNTNSNGMYGKYICGCSISGNKLILCGGYALLLETIDFSRVSDNSVRGCLNGIKVNAGKGNQINNNSIYDLRASTNRMADSIVTLSQTESVAIGNISSGTQNGYSFDTGVTLQLNNIVVTEQTVTA